MLFCILQGEATGIGNEELRTYKHESIYDLQGRKMGSNSSTLRKGLYIIRSAEGRLQGKNGRKVVK